MNRDKANKIKGKYELPRASICCFLLEPGGRPLAFFKEEGEADPAEAGGEENAPPDWDTFTPEGAGDNASAMVPSGPYFLGLPLFLFKGSLPIFMLSPWGMMAPPVEPSPPVPPEDWYGGEVPETGLYTAAPSGLKAKRMFCITGCDGTAFFWRPMLKGSLVVMIPVSDPDIFHIWKVVLNFYTTLQLKMGIFRSAKTLEIIYITDQL